MSQLRNEEFIIPEPQSSSTQYTSIDSTQPGQDYQLCSSSSSPTTSSTEYHNSELLDSNQKENIEDDNDTEISGSLSSSQSNVSISAGVTDSSSHRNPSWKSFASGSEDLTTDVSQSSSVSSESEKGSQVKPTEENICHGKDQYSTDDFETDDSECEEGLSVESLKNVSSVTVSDSSKDHRNRASANQPQSYRVQGTRRNNLIIGEARREIFAGRERNFRRVENHDLGLLRRLDNFLHNMSVRVARYHKELCIVFLVFASGLASLRSPPPKIRVVSTPNPFFEDKDASYFLQDNYLGEYVDLANKQIPYHPSFLFYYAPWDSESVAAKSAFLNVAKHFFFANHGRVKFYAINCWWPGGQCRKNYKNLSHYPIFVAHIGKSAGIIYNGPIREEPMIKFISSLLKPVTRIDTEEELWHFRAQHDVIMLGYFNFTMEDSTEAYETYLQMALRTFEADPFNQVGFGLFLRSELAEKFFLTSSNAISLVLFNEIHTAKWHGGYHAQGLKGPVSQVAEWIIERTKTVPLTWVYALRNGFANRPAALGPHDFAQQLSKGPVFLLITRRYFPSGHSPFYTQVKEVALDYYNCNKSGNVTKLRRTSHKVNSEWASIWSTVVQICHRRGSFQCQQLLPNIKHWEKRRALFKREPLSRYENVSSTINFTGLSCESERQFKFLAIDPVDVPYFVDLGLSGLKSMQRGDGEYDLDPMAFIIDSQNDIMLPLPSLNISDMAIAIHNYTAIMENGDIESLPQSLQWSRNENVHPEKPRVRKTSSLKNWSSTDVLEYVRGNPNESDSVLLLYTASFCGFCGIAVTHLVGLSRFLAENYGDGNLKVTLAKIDMLKNSLPPRLSPEQLPTVVFLPSWNRTDVRMYPESQEISSLGLLRFILSELDPHTRVQASLMTPSCGLSNGSCLMSDQESATRCNPSALSSSQALWSKTNLTSEDRVSCIKSSRTSVSSQIELLLQKLQNGEEAMFDKVEGPLYRMTTQHWNGQLLDRLRTMAVTLEVS